MGFDIALGAFFPLFPHAFLLFYPLTKYFSQRARGFWGAPKPAWIGHLRAPTLKRPVYAGLRENFLKMPTLLFFCVPHSNLWYTARKDFCVP